MFQDRLSTLNTRCIEGDKRIGKQIFINSYQWRRQDFVREGPVTDVVRVQSLAILHKDHFEVTAQSPV